MAFNLGKNNENNEEMGLILGEMQETRKLLTTIVSNQDNTLAKIEKQDEEIREIKDEVLDLKNWRENEARITPTDCGTLQRNGKSAVTLFLKKYDLPYQTWWHKAFPAHNIYIANSCGVSRRGDILLKDRDKAIKLSLTVNENFWKIQSLLTEAAINNGMPIKWEKSEENDYWEVIKKHIELGDLEYVRQHTPNQIFDEIAKRKLLKAKAKANKSTT